jgi:hypothetical protein
MKKTHSNTDKIEKVQAAFTATRNGKGLFGLDILPEPYFASENIDRVKPMKKSYEPIKLKKLLEILQGAYDKHKDNPECADAIAVEFWQGNTELALKRIGQFSVVPTVTIDVGKK